MNKHLSLVYFHFIVLLLVCSFCTKLAAYQPEAFQYKTLYSMDFPVNYNTTGSEDTIHYAIFSTHKRIRMIFSRKGFNSILVIIFISTCLSKTSQSQTLISVILTGSQEVLRNKNVEFSQGLSSELQVGWTMYDKLDFSIGVQHTFWRNTNEYVKNMKTTLFEAKWGIQQSFRDYILHYQLGFDFAMNDICFDPKATPEPFRRYQEDLHWNTLCLAPQLELEHDMGFLTRLGYRHYIGTNLLPAYNFGFVEVGLGYRFKLKMK